MASYEAVTSEAFSGRRWHRYRDYRFAAQDAVAPIVAQEFPRVAMSAPIAFLSQDGSFTPVAVQGLAPGKNLFVAADGRWLGSYVPAAYRGYPFALAALEDGRQALCMDTESGLLSEDGGGEPFFDEEGAVAAPLAGVLDFLGKVAENRQRTRLVCDLLGELGLIAPWPLKLRTEQGEQSVDGLYRIDEGALNALTAESLDRLRQAGGLAFAYSQLLSMQHVDRLGKLAQAHAAAAQPLPTNEDGDLDLEFLNDDTLKF